MNGSEKPGEDANVRTHRTRRRFLLKLMALVAGGGAWTYIFPKSPFAADDKASKILLPRGTDPRSLTHRNPREIDTRYLEPMPLEDFKTMGLSDHRVDLAGWRLTVGGNVRIPLSLNYSEITNLPALEKNVLLICPGVFCNHGRWRGVSIRTLLELAGGAQAVTHVSVRGPMGPYQKTHQLALNQIGDDRAFLAYAVNGVTLPVRHGFPLRLVSTDDYGFDWVKYVAQIEATIIAGEGQPEG